MMQQVHGNDKYNYTTHILADFSSNVWYKPLANSFYEKLSWFLPHTKDYPHPSADDLRAEIASFHQLEIENVWVVNGSVEGMYLLSEAFSFARSGIICPAFSEYENACTRYNHKINFLPGIENLFDERFDFDLLWLGNPNNPDGRVVPVAVLEELLRQNPSMIVIVDEAFADLCLGFESAKSLLAVYENLVILRSFTKAFSIPGIRLGYLLASPKIIQMVQAYSIPWGISSVAVAAGKIILEDYFNYKPDVKKLAASKFRLESYLSEFNKMVVLPSATNYYLVELKKGDAGSLKKHLVNNFGLLIRDASGFEGLDQRFFRISCQSEENVKMLTKALKSYFNECS